MKDKTYIEKLTIERQELFEKIQKLRNFFDSKKCKEISNESFNNLQIQLSIMVAYKDILDIRILKENK